MKRMISFTQEVRSAYVSPRKGDTVIVLLLVEKQKLC